MPLEITEPSWMIRLNDSSIGGVGYANYLTIPLSFGKDLPREERDVQIREQVAGFISELNELQGPYYIQVNRHRRMGRNAPDISRSQVSFRQVKHRVTRAMAETSAASGHAMDIVTSGSRITVNVDLSHVRIRRYGTQVSLVESDLFRAIGIFIEKYKSGAGTPPPIVQTAGK